MIGAGHAAAAATAAAAAIAVAVPAAAARGGWRTVGIAGGAPLLAGAVAGAVSTGAGPALLAALPLAGFALLLAGSVRALRALRVPPAAAAALAALAGCGLLVLPFVGDPLVEAGGPGKGLPAAVGLLVGGSPLCASVGGALDVDVLRSPRAYGPSGGGLSRIGPFYDYAYPGPLAAGAAFAAAGLLLLAAGAGLARRRATA